MCRKAAPGSFKEFHHRSFCVPVSNIEREREKERERGAKKSLNGVLCSWRLEGGSFLIDSHVTLHHSPPLSVALMRDVDRKTGTASEATSHNQDEDDGSRVVMTVYHLIDQRRGGKTPLVKFGIWGLVKSFSRDTNYEQMQYIFS